MVCRGNEINREETTGTVFNCFSSTVFVQDPYPAFKSNPDVPDLVANFFFFNKASTGFLQQFELGFTVL